MAEGELDKREAFRNLVRQIFRRKTLFLLGAALAAIVGLLGAHYAPLKDTGRTVFERRTDAAAPGGASENRDTASDRQTLRVESPSRAALFTTPMAASSTLYSARANRISPWGLPTRPA